MSNDISTDVQYSYTIKFVFFLFFKIRVYKRNNERLIDDASLFLFFVDPLLD